MFHLQSYQHEQRAALVVWLARQWNGGPATLRFVRRRALSVSQRQQRAALSLAELRDTAVQIESHQRGIQLWMQLVFVCPAQSTTDERKPDCSSIGNRVVCRRRASEQFPVSSIAFKSDAGRMVLREHQHELFQPQ